MGKKKPNGYFSKMSDKKLIKYIGEKFKGKTLNESRRNSAQAHKIARSRGLINTLLERGILTRARKAHGFFKNMSNKNLCEYLEENYNGKTIKELREKDSSVYAFLLARYLVDSLIEKGVLIRMQRKNVFLVICLIKNLFNLSLIIIVEKI